MKTMKSWKGWLSCVPFLLASCSGDTVQAPAEDETARVLFSIDEFEPAGGSRTTLNTSDYTVTWAQGDCIGIFPYEGWQEPFNIPDDQAGKGTATFDGGYWAMKEGKTYNAYYPFSPVNFSSADAKKAIPVDYTSQSQAGAVCNVGPYLYTYSEWNTPTSGKINFQFHHIGALVIFHVTCPAAANYTQLALSTGEVALIPTKGTYDLTANKENKDLKIPFVADDASKASSLSMDLTGCNATEGVKNTFYMMVPPMDLSRATLTLVLTAEGGNTYSSELAPTNFESSKKYEFTIAPIELGDITASPWTNVTVNEPLETE